MTDHRVSLFVMTVLLAAGGAFALTFTVPVVGTKLIIVDRLATASTAKAVFVTKDANVAAAGFGNPSEASLYVAYDSVSGSWIMPPGPDWLVTPIDIGKYVNKEAPIGGTVKTSTIKRSQILKVVAASLGDEPLDISEAPSGPVLVAHIMENGVTYRHCTQFTACAHKVIAGGTGYKLVCRGNSVGDPSCAAAPPTTTTTLPPCVVPPEATWTCCQAPSFACSAEYRTTGDAAAFCAMSGGTAVPGRCGPPACAAQGCCTNAFHLVMATCTDFGFDGTVGQAATDATTCTVLGGSWSPAPCP